MHLHPCVHPDKLASPVLQLRVADKVHIHGGRLEVVHPQVRGGQARLRVWQLNARTGWRVEWGGGRGAVAGRGSPDSSSSQLRPGGRDPCVQIQKLAVVSISAAAGAGRGESRKRRASWRPRFCLGTPTQPPPPSPRRRRSHCVRTLTCEGPTVDGRARQLADHASDHVAERTAAVLRCAPHVAG